MESLMWLADGLFTGYCSLQKQIEVANQRRQSWNLRVYAFSLFAKTAAETITFGRLFFTAR